MCDVCCCGDCPLLVVDRRCVLCLTLCVFVFWYVLFAVVIVFLFVCSVSCAVLVFVVC